MGVFFAPTSEWRLIATATIASRLQENLRSGIITTMRFPREVSADVTRFGVDVDKALKTRLLRIADWYTCITGRVPADLPEDMPPSLKVADLGLISAKQWHMGQGTKPETNPDFVEFALFDNITRLFSYNDESSCIRFLNTTLARMKQDTRVTMCGFAAGVLTEKTYSDLESMCDGTIDVKTVEAGGVAHTILRVRSFPDIRHTKGWYAIATKPHAVSLVPAYQAGGDVSRAVTSLENTPQPH